MAALQPSRIQPVAPSIALSSTWYSLVSGSPLSMPLELETASTRRLVIRDSPLPSSPRLVLLLLAVADLIEKSSTFPCEPATSALYSSLQGYAALLPNLGEYHGTQRRLTLRFIWRKR